MTPPPPPATGSIRLQKSKVSVISLHHVIVHDLCNTVMQLIYVKLYKSLFYYYLVYAQLISAHAGDKRFVFR